MKIVVAVRCYNEEKNIERFLRGYDFADEIVVSDGGSDDNSIELLQKNPKVTLIHFERYESKDGKRWNPDNPHINFVLDKAKSLEPDWLIFDDMDDVPNRLLREQARAFLENCNKKQANAFRLYMWGEDKFFPEMNKNFHPDYRSLWAWKPKEIDIRADETFHHGTIVGITPDYCGIDRPLCLLHKSWHPDTIVKKMENYKTFGIEMNHPIQSAGVLEGLPDWAVECGMKIALVMPRSTFIENPMIFQPLGLFYIAARLESLGHTTEFFDLNVDEFPKDEYDQIWVSATSPQMMEIKRIGQILSSYKAKSVLGGASVWAHPEGCKELGYDLIVGGEADSPENVKKIMETQSGYLFLPVSKTLNWVLPPIRRWSRKYHSYLTDFQGVQRPCTTMFTSRGCPLECAFCESGRHGIIWDRLTRYEPLEVVERQIKECYDMGYRALAYYDDILPLNKKRMLEIMELHRKYGMIWRCFLRSDIINNHGGFEYMQAMADGGLVEIFVGVESADNRIKEGITKKTTIEQDENIVKWCRELGIKCKLSFILGLPGESMESMETTRRWILAQDPKGLRIQLGRLIPFAGTPLTKKPENYDLKYETQIDDEWFYRGKMDLDSHSFVSTSHLTVAEIDTFWRNLENELDEKGYSK